MVVQQHQMPTKGVVSCLVSRQDTTLINLHNAAMYFGSIFFDALLVGDYIFPDKQAVLLTIYKSGNGEDLANYRPVLAKVFQGLVLDKLSFATKHVIVPKQHGIPNQSKHNLILLKPAYFQY